MLVIRREQMAALERAVEERFIDRVIDHLRSHHPRSVASLDDATLRRRVEAGVARGRRYGLEWESSLTTFVALMFISAPNFDEDPVIHRILTSTWRTADLRIARIFDRCGCEDWRRVRANRDASSWDELDKSGP